MQDPIFQHFWIALFAVTWINAFIYQKRSSSRFAHDAALAARAKRLIWGSAFWMSLPWLLLGFGVESGLMRGMDELFWAARVNPFVRIWYTVLAGLWVLGTAWVFTGAGAESISSVAIEYNPLWTVRNVRWAWLGAMLWNFAIGTVMVLDVMGIGQGRVAAAPVAVSGVNVVAVFPFVFMAIWCGICLLLSLIGGWWALGKEYKAREPFVGERFYLRSGSMGGTSYGSCLNLGSGQAGFYLAVLFPFRLGHPPLLVPWSDVTVAEEKIFWIRRVVFRFKRSPKIRFGMSRRMALKLKQDPWAAGALKGIEP